MKKELTVREINIVARMLRLGMPKPQIAQIMRVDKKYIDVLSNTDSACRQQYEIAKSNSDVVIEVETPQKSIYGPEVRQTGIDVSKIGYPNQKHVVQHITKMFEIPEADVKSDLTARRVSRCREACVIAIKIQFKHLSLDEIDMIFNRGGRSYASYVLRKHKISTGTPRSKVRDY